MAKTDTIASQNNLKTFVLGGSYVQLKSVKNKFVQNHGLWISASTMSLKSSKVGADMTLAGMKSVQPFTFGDLDMFALVHFKYHLPIPFPFMQMIQICL